MDFPSVLEKYRLAVEGALADHLQGCQGPPQLLEAMGYSLMAGGKRVRGILTLAARDIFPPSPQNPSAEAAACAVEFIHTYSLIHDDLPAMDDDDLRRGKPSCHKRFGEALAILAGDALLTEAFRLICLPLLGRADGRAGMLVQELALAAGSGGMVGGQTLDMEAMGRPMDRPRLEEIHRLKTGALLRAPVRLGAILGGATQDELAKLTRYSEAIGLAFQVVDDLLDVVADPVKLGKTKGKDAAQGKTTYVSLLGLEACRTFAGQLAQEAQQAIAPFGEAARPLAVLARFIVERAY